MTDQEIEKSKYPLGDFLKTARKKKDLGIREVCRLIDKSPNTAITVSPSYLSQVERGTGFNTENISIDFFWAVGIILEIDPLKLFVLSRTKIPRAYLDPEKRKRAFPIG